MIFRDRIIRLAWACSSAMVEFFATGAWAFDYEVPLEPQLSSPIPHFSSTMTSISNPDYTLKSFGYLGRVKEISKTSIDYDKNGLLTSKLQAVTSFYEDGRERDSISTDLLKNIIVRKAEYIYDTDKKIESIRTVWPTGGISKPTGVIKYWSEYFSYDPRGYLTKLTAVNNDGTYGTVEITNDSRGRPTESITRMANGHGVERLVYEYGEHEVTIDSFFDNYLKGETKSVFKLDNKGRPSTIQTTARFSIYANDSASASLLNYNGNYRYQYRSDGTKSLHSDRKNLYSGQSCIADMDFFPDGSINEKSINVTKKGDFILSCDDPKGDKYEVTLDDRKNIIHSRKGNIITELGKKVTRWESEEIRVFEYYSVN